jgi:hypothetical protein
MNSKCNLNAGAYDNAEPQEICKMSFSTTQIGNTTVQGILQEDAKLLPYKIQM